MRKATLYYGYLSSAEFIGLLQEAGVQRQFALELSKYLACDSKGHIFLDSLYELLEGKRAVNPYVFAHFCSS